MNKTKQSTQNSEGNVTKSIFWGTIALAGILLLVTGYFVSFLLKLDKTPIIYIGLAVFLFALGASLVSLGLTIRGRQRSGAEIVLYAISVLGITLIAIFQDRMQFTILTLSVITIFTCFQECALVFVGRRGDIHHDVFNGPSAWRIQIAWLHLHAAATPWRNFDALAASWAATSVKPT
jgi:uncharacterized membrane protein YhaH (DUF805 family)